uniref:Calmodulin-lysine N-methyltransferase n=1 Tax=Fibrocapsa japonica TaxID=94617 RepID=A0A7S2XUQ7_9STRA|mmetsp:Transcript_11378/g.16777  ORF Transcript_11378/g.16777 Transcript_11378/m.16777 type:complete len:101 (+) Transcript_11378:2-304(+)
MDLCIASDCIYNPQCHVSLLQSCKESINEAQGRIVIGFSLHGNVDDSAVFNFFTIAQQEPFNLFVTNELTYDFETQNAATWQPNNKKRAQVHIKVLAVVK